MMNDGYQVEQLIDAGGLCVRVMALAATIADEYGLTDEGELRRCLPDSSWLAHWDRIVEMCGFHRICGQLATKRTRKTEVAAALMAIGRPATIAEIETRLAPELSGESFRIGSVISQMDDVIRATKTEWGFEDWIADEYEGIPAEIVQRINEDGGSTRLNRLLEELPRMFGVNAASVWAYLNTPAFRVEHGWVSEADAPAIAVGRLDDVIDGRDDNDDPYWSFSVYDRHLTGYSLQGVPPEVVAALGCYFGTKTTATVRSPHRCQDISVIWRKTSIHGPEIGRLGPALRALGVEDGADVRLTIHSSSEVTFSLTSTRKNPLQKHPQRLAAATSSFQQLPPTLGGVTTATPLSARLRVPADQYIESGSTSET
ncbi:MAG: hypothetical protein F4X47_15185 [Gammaproteobacteria bacterium]|nr:hypothetical protein [Gammaproteobacteria bacterium]